MKDKLPHSVRLVVFFLRVALGLDFFYLGFTSLFNPQLGKTIGERSLGDLYAWLAAPGASLAQFQTAFAWAFLVIGACLVVGFLTRLVSILGLFIILASLFPGAHLSPPGLISVVNDEVIVGICLLLLIAANAGKYLGLDAFFRFSARNKN
jgi:uncharacterized membrane protein YphA (DoxX/SURF4 family)